jgi:hypothetical protein
MADSRPSAAQIVERALREARAVDAQSTQRTALRVGALEQALRDLAARVDELEQRVADADR